MYPKFLKNSLPYFFITGIALFMFRGIFAPGFMSGYDNSFHYYDAYYLTKTLIPQYHWISGWSMQSMAGLPIFVDYYQIGFLFIAFLNKILFLPLNFSYKIMVLFSYIFLGVGFFKISSYRFGKVPSLVIAICLMLQKDIYLDMILGGIWNNYLGIGLFFIFFYILYKEIKSITIKKSLILGLLLGLLILTHLFVALFAFILLFIYMASYLVIEGVNKKRLFFRQFLIHMCIPISAFMISAYYLYGFIAARNYFSKMPPKDLVTGFIWSLKSFFGPLENSSNILLTFMINLPIVIRIIFSFLGMYIFFKNKKKSDTRSFLIHIFIFIFIALIFFSDILANLFGAWKNIPLIGTLQTDRFLIYIHIGLYLFAAYGLAKFLEGFRKRKILATVLFVSIVGSVFFNYTYLARDFSRTLEQSVHMPNIYRIWSWVNKNISPKKERIVYQSTIGNMDDSILRRSDVFALSGVFTKIPQIGVSRGASPFPQEKYMRNDHGRIFGRDIKTADDFFIKDMMNYFNARYIVSVEPSLENKISKSKLFFKEKELGPFSIFRVKNFKGGWVAFERDAGYKTLDFDNQYVEFSIFNKSINNEAFIKIAYHPFWRAQLNDKPVKIKQDDYSLMKISLPHKGNYRLALSYNSINYLWIAVSALSLIAVLILILYFDRKA